MSSRNTSVEELSLLHVTRIKGVTATDRTNAALADLVARLTDDGMVRLGPRGLTLTADGLRRHEELLAAHRATVDIDTLAATYERFLGLNVPVKATCAQWQQSARDEEALFVASGDLAGYLERLVPALNRAAEIAEWFASYRVRLLVAAEQALEGDGRFVTDPKVDSFHNIWFECHEDYLVTLGRSREEEEAR